MSTVDELVTRLRTSPDCIAAPVAGPPPAGLPADLRRFYEICGGAVLFTAAAYRWIISGPRGLVPTNIEVLGDQVEDDITATWVVIARQEGDSSALISLDMRDDRLGWCYDSDAEVHGLVGDCAVLAHSFTELLGALMGARGGHLFWEDERFVPKGDASAPMFLPWDVVLSVDRRGFGPFNRLVVTPPTRADLGRPGQAADAAPPQGFPVPAHGPAAALRPGVAPGRVARRNGHGLSGRCEFVPETGLQARGG